MKDLPALVSQPSWARQMKPGNVKECGHPIVRGRVIPKGLCREQQVFRPGTAERNELYQLCRLFRKVEFTFDGDFICFGNSYHNL